MTINDPSRKAYVSRVCAQLGREPNDANCDEVDALLRRNRVPDNRDPASAAEAIRHEASPSFTRNQYGNPALNTAQPQLADPAYPDRGDPRAGSGGYPERRETVIPSRPVRADNPNASRHVTEDGSVVYTGIAGANYYAQSPGVPRPAGYPARDDAAAAAAAIRADVDLSHVHRDPVEDQHRMRFVADVCRHLGLEPTDANCRYVDGLLKEHDIDGDAYNEWPKHYYHVDGRDISVASEEEAKELGEGWSDNPDAQREARVKHLEEVASAPTATAADKRAAGQARAQLNAAKNTAAKDDRYEATRVA